MTAEQARRRARLDLGGVEKVKEECRDARGLNFIDTLLQDIRYGVRVLSKSPATTLLVLCLLGIGGGSTQRYRIGLFPGCVRPRSVHSDAVVEVERLLPFAPVAGYLN